MRNGIYLIWLLMLAFPFSNLTIATTFTVTNTLDEGEGSFRWSIEESNSHVGPDTVLFAIPISDPGYNPELGVWTIETDTLQSPDWYYIHDDGTFVDGDSQARFVGGAPNPYGPEIEIECRTVSTCLVIHSDNNTIRGLCIHHARHGIRISSWPPEGVAENNVVAGCYINVDPTGSRAEGDSREGINLNAIRGVRIGGDAPEDRNIIAAGTVHNINSSSCADVEIINNHIGADRTGTVDLGADLGTLRINSATGSHVVRDNLIAGHWMELVTITHTDPDSGIVTFIGNRVGVGLDGSPMGGHFNNLFLSDAPRHLIQENTIAHSHGSWGIYLMGDITDYVTISRNSIYECRGGINLSNSHIENYHGVDFVDGVYGPGVNEEIDTPLCESITSDLGGDVVTTAYFRCMPECVVEVFIADPSVRGVCSESGYDYVYSGMTYLGDAEEVVQGPVWSTYRFSVSPTLPVGTLVTCTATNKNGSTSEFGCSCQVPLAGEIAEGCIPEGYAFEASAPNRGRDGLDLRYRIPEPALVQIRVYDVAGRQVAVIADGPEQAGEHTVLWKPRRRNGTVLPSGTYLVRLTTDRFVATREVVVVR